MPPKKEGAGAPSRSIARVALRLETPPRERSKRSRLLEVRGLEEIGIGHAGLEFDIVVEAGRFATVQHVEHRSADTERRPSIEVASP